IEVDAGDADPHRPTLPQMPGERPRVDSADSDDALGGQPLLEGARGPPTRRCAGRIAHHVTRYPDPVGLVVLIVDAGVADVRRGLDDDLPVVGRIRERLLVPGHGRGEDGLAEGLPHGAVGFAAERAAVLEDQDRLAALPHRVAFPSSTVGRPCRNVATIRAGRVLPAYGVLRLREASAPGSTVQVASGSTSVRLAGLPSTGSSPCPARPAMRAGARDIRSAMPSQPSSARRTETTMESAVSRPSISGRAYL